MKKVCISKGWTFRSPDYKGTEIVDLPHDYVITLPRCKDAPGGKDTGFFIGTSGSYSKYLHFPEAEHLILHIDGAYMCARISLNESLIDMHPHGYTPYLVDLSDRVRRGRTNKLRLDVSHLQPSTRWYSGSGIYRDVYVWSGGKVRIEPWDLFAVTKSISNGKAELGIMACVRSDMPCKTKIKLEILNDESIPVAEFEAEESLAQGDNEREYTIEVENPRLWDCDNPYLYTVQVTMEVDDQVEDVAKCPLGIRTLEVNAREGFLLNGKSIKLRGGCIHHDHGALGSAEFPAAVQRKIFRLKEAGFNALRIAHNPPSLTMLETCDRMGMLLMDEAFDMWNVNKKDFDYSLWFRDWWQRDISYMVKRDRSHPCVVSYSIGNEVRERNGWSDGAMWSEKLTLEVKKYDTTRPVTSCACGMWDDCDPNAPEDYREDFMEGFADTGSGAIGTSWDRRTEGYMAPLDMVGYNYLFQRYAYDHIRYPNRVIWGSESKAQDLYVAWKNVMENNHVIGDFVWTAWDNLGEVGTGRSVWGEDGFLYGCVHGDYPWRSCYQGDFDLCGYRRPQSYYREALWKNITAPHIFTQHPKHNGDQLSGTTWHWYDVEECWSFDEKFLGKPVMTQVYTTADEILFELNGKEVCRVVPDRCIATAEISYEPGTLKATAFRAGVVETSFTLDTTGPAYKLRVVPECEEFVGDNRDLCFFEIFVEDEDGRLVTDANMELECQVIGGKLLAFFSGDPNNLDQYGSNKCHAFRGRALAVVRNPNPGGIRLYVHGENMKGGVAAPVRATV